MDIAAARINFSVERNYHMVPAWQASFLGLAPAPGRGTQICWANMTQPDCDSLSPEFPSELVVPLACSAFNLREQSINFPTHPATGIAIAIAIAVARKLLHFELQMAGGHDDDVATG